MPLRLLTSVLGGVALALAFEPAALAFLMPVGLVALLWSTGGRTVLQGALLGLVFGAGFMIPLLIWIRVVGNDAWVLLALFEALYLALAGAGLSAVSRLRLWPLWSALVWVGVETLRGDWPMSGLTWGRLAFAVIDTPFEAWLPWVGASGVAVVVVLASAGALWVIQKLWGNQGFTASREHQPPRRSGVGRRGLAALALTAIAATVCLPWVLPHSTSNDGSRTVAVVQGDVPGTGDNLLAHHRAVTQSHVDLTSTLADDVAAGDRPVPDFVLWPENATAVDPFRDELTRESLATAAAAVGVPILVGAIVDAENDDEVLNQGIVLDPETGAGDRYTKRHPVPFGEYIPARSFFGRFGFSRLDQVPRDMIAGTRKEPLRIADTDVVDVICFDISYDDTIVDQVTRGGELIVVQTSNAMFIHTGQIDQQFAISRVRALETGRTVVVAAVNGLSGVIGPDGTVEASLEPRTRATLVDEVQLSSEITLAMRIGPWVGRLGVLLGLVAAGAGVLSYRLPSNRPARQGEQT